MTATTPDERAALTAQLTIIRARADAAPLWPPVTVTNRLGDQKLDTSQWTTAEWNAMQPETVAFIAAARTDVPSLLAIIDRQAKRLALAEKTIERTQREWADYFEHIGSHVGDPEFTQEFVVGALRGTKPFGTVAAV